MTYGSPQSPGSPHDPNQAGGAEQSGPPAYGGPPQSGPAYSGQPYGGGSTYGAQMPHTGQQPAVGSPYGDPGAAQQPGGAPRRRAVGEAGFLGALVDLTFRHFVTVKFAAFIYIVNIAQVVLAYLGFIIAGFVVGVGIEMAWLGIVVLLFGWIPAILNIIWVRISLEFIVAAIRTAQNTTVLVDQGNRDAVQ